MHCSAFDSECVTGLSKYIPVTIYINKVLKRTVQRRLLFLTLHSIFLSFNKWSRRQHCSSVSLGQYFCIFICTMYNVHKWWVFTRHYRVRIWLSDMTTKTCCYVDCIGCMVVHILINNNYKRASCAGLDLQKLQNTPFFSCTKKRIKDCVF
jgi:hypothetical protein